jgi:acyl-CoA thioesterase I
MNTKQWIRISWALVLLFGLAACGQKTPQIGALAEDAVLLAFGDSLTYGTGADPAESYPAQLEKLLGRRVLNAGVPGEVSEKGVARLPALLDKHRPDVLLLCHGGNDFLQHKDESALIDNMRKMIQEAQKRNIAVVLIGVPEIAPIMINAAPLYYQIAKVNKIPYEGQSLARILSSADMKSDHVHPNAAGYRRMAEDLQNLLRAAGAIASES